MENSQQTCFSFRWHTPIPPDHPIGSNYRLCSMCLYIVWPLLPAAVGPCIPSQAVMEARCLPVCLRLIINSLTQTFSPSLSSATACYERICGLSVLQTSGSVSKVRLTNWIPLVSFCLDGGGGGGGCGEGAGGRETIPPCSLNKLQDTAALFLQRSHIGSGIPREM